MDRPESVEKVQQAREPAGASSGRGRTSQERDVDDRLNRVPDSTKLDIPQKSILDSGADLDLKQLILILVTVTCLIVCVAFNLDFVLEHFLSIALGFAAFGLCIGVVGTVLLLTIKMFLGRRYRKRLGGQGRDIARTTAGAWNSSSVIPAPSADLQGEDRRASSRAANSDDSIREANASD
jgi:hypothetical protein